MQLLIFCICGNYLHRFRIYARNDFIDFVLSRIITARKTSEESERKRENECRERRDGGKKEKRSWCRRQSVISSVIDHRATRWDWPEFRGCRRNAGLRLARGKCEKIFCENVQCLSSEMIYRNDALFFYFSFLRRCQRDQWCDAICQRVAPTIFKRASWCDDAPMIFPRC